MSQYTLSLSGIGDAIPAVSFEMADPHSGYAQIARHPDVYTPTLFHAQTTGTHIAKGAVTLGGVTYTFEDLILTSYQVHDELEMIELSYRKVEMDAVDTSDPDAQPHHAGYDVSTLENS